MLFAMDFYQWFGCTFICMVITLGSAMPILKAIGKAGLSRAASGKW
jgi:hypothetical protein